MLGDISVADEIYIVCGYMDMRRSIDGLCAIVQDRLHMDPRQRALYLFCGKRCDRLKALLWEGEYYGAAEPPVRTNGATPFSVVISYFAIAGSNPYTSRIERSLDGSMLSISILYESYVIRSIMASARVLSPRDTGTLHRTHGFDRIPDDRNTSACSHLYTETSF